MQYNNNKVYYAAKKAQQAFERKNIRAKIGSILQYCFDKTGKEKIKNKVQALMSQNYFNIQNEINEETVDLLVNYRHTYDNQGKPVPAKECNLLVNTIYEQYKTKVRELQKEDKKRPYGLKHYRELDGVDLDKNFFI